MEERAFTWFPKLTRVLKALPAENVAEFALAVAAYGTDGEEPSFSSPILAAVFEGVRDDVDNSVNARTKNKGGRPKAENRRENGGSEVLKTKETPVSEFSESAKPPLREASETENPPYINQTNPIQANTSQTKEMGKRARPRFVPPTAEEVAEHVAEKGYCFDPEAFTAYYESVGWRVGDKPMKSWQAACVTWERRERAEKGGGHGAGDVYSKL